MPAQIAARTTSRSRRSRRPRLRRETAATLVATARPERARRFAELQRGLTQAWAAACAGLEGASIVVVPSRAVDKWHETPVETRAYEERLLCLLLLLRHPGLHVVYVTSEPVAPAIVDYYLSLLQDVTADDARSRLTPARG